MYNLYDTEKDLEKDGIWYEPCSDFRVKLARAGGANQKYQSVIEKLSKPHRRAIAADACDPSVVNNILKTAFAKTIVRGWQIKVDGVFKDGIADPEDVSNILPVTSENVLKVLDAFNDLFLDIKDMADGAAAFRKLEDEEDSKN